MKRKYEFTGEVNVVIGVTLKQIRATLSFGAITKGEVGGWIEGEDNFSPDAQVSGNAWVSGDARVSGDALVYGDAQFFLVGPLGSRRAFLTIHADIKLGVRFSTGCFSGSEYQFKEAIQQTHGDNEHALQYRAAIALAVMIVKPATVQS